MELIIGKEGDVPSISNRKGNALMLKTGILINGELPRLSGLSARQGQFQHRGLRCKRDSKK
jgi:hypothetical protein